MLRGGYGLYFDQSNTRRRGGRRLSEQAADERAGDADEHRDRRRRAGHVPLRDRSDAGDSRPNPTRCRAARRASGWRPTSPIPYNHQVHVGYAHELAANTTLSVDYTHVEGRNEFRPINLNPIVNGTARAGARLPRVFGVPNVPEQRDDPVGDQQVAVRRADIRVPAPPAARDDAGALHAGAARTRTADPPATAPGAPVPQDQFDQFADGEWGPVGNDERHRVVAMGVFEMPWGIQLSPVFQAASARPYNLTAGCDLNGDGNNNDR